MIRTFALLLLILSPALGRAGEVMFEGYYKVELENKPIGYVILRYEFDPKTSIFTAYSFTRVKQGEKVIQESLKARSTDKFRPIDYHYTSSVGEKLTGIDAMFKGEIMTLKITDGKKLRTETYKNPKGTFLSSFLPYLMLQRKDLKLNEAFRYSAVAEEDGGSYWGKAWLQAKEAKSGYDVYTVANDYKKEKFFSKMAIVKDSKDPSKNIRGEVLSTSSPDKNLTTRLVAAPLEATEGQLVPNKTLLTLFGTLPTGKINLVASATDADVTSKKQMATLATPVEEDAPALIPDTAPQPPPAKEK